MAATKQLYVYILLCSDTLYYTGITNNYEERLMQHNNGYDSNCYTFKRRPVKLMYVENFQEHSQALDREKQIKRWSRNKKEAIINHHWKELQKLSECKNETHSRFKAHSA